MKSLRFQLAVLIVAVLLLIPSMVIASGGQTMIAPVRYPKVSWNREYDPPNHWGIDLVSKKPWWKGILATSDGVANNIRTGSRRGDMAHGGAGNFVVIEHKPGDSNRKRRYCASSTFTFYCHLSSVFVQKDQPVSQGDIIGTIGNTGNTKGPTGMHLHFEIRENGYWGQRVNPREYIIIGDGNDLIRAAPKKKQKLARLTTTWAKVKAE